MMELFKNKYYGYNVMALVNEKDLMIVAVDKATGEQYVESEGSVHWVNISKGGVVEEDKLLAIENAVLAVADDVEEWVIRATGKSIYELGYVLMPDRK